MLELMPPFYFITFAKVSVSVSKTFGLKKSLGIGLEKKSWYRSRKHLVSKKSLGIGLDEIFWSRHSVPATLHDNNHRPNIALHTFCNTQYATHDYTK